MNISEFCIRRPVATIADVGGARGRRPLRLQLPAGGGAAARRISRSINVSASLPGASPDTMANVGRDAADQAVLDDRRHRHDQRRPARRARPRSSIQFELNRDIDAAAADVQAAIARTQRQLPAEHDRRRRATARSIRPTRRSCSWRCSSDIDAAAEARRLCRAGDLAGAVDHRRRRRRCRSSAARNMPCASRSIPTRLPRAASASTRCSTAVAAANANHAGRHARRTPSSS